MKRLNFLICFIITLSLSACEEKEGTDELNEIYIELAGANCTDGGYKLVTGIDVNNNTVIDASEILEIEYVCSPINPTFTSSQHILEDYSVKSMVFVEDEIVWIGTKSNGLIKYDPNKKTPVSSVIPGIKIWDMDVDSQGNVWIASYGLIKYDGQKATYFTTDNSDIPEDIVWSLAIDSNDKIWMSSSRIRLGGLTTYDGSDWEVFTPDNSDLPVNMVQWVEIGENDDVWLSLCEWVGGPFFVKISEDVWTVYSKEDIGFVPDWLRKIQLNSKNELVCGIDILSGPLEKYNLKAFRFNGQSSQRFFYNSISVITSLTVDDEDKIWCVDGYSYLVFDGDSLYYSDDNLIDVGLYAIEQANDGKMWIGTNNGVYIIDK